MWSVRYRCDIYGEKRLAYLCDLAEGVVPRSKVTDVSTE